MYCERRVIVSSLTIRTDLHEDLSVLEGWKGGFTDVEVLDRPCTVLDKNCAHGYDVIGYPSLWRSGTRVKYAIFVAVL